MCAAWILPSPFVATLLVWGKIGDFGSIIAIYLMMDAKSHKPVTQAQLLDLIALLAQRLDAIVSNGLVLSEGADDYEVEKLRLKISQKQSDLSRLRQQLSKVRSIISRKRQLEKQRHNKSHSEH